jgi:hypothetical protein
MARVYVEDMKDNRKMAHTPEPWTIQPGRYTYGADMTKWDVSEKDARLAAAAPELLGALKQAVYALSNGSKEDRLIAQQRGYEVIAKAEGKEG